MTVWRKTRDHQHLYFMTAIPSFACLAWLAKEPVFAQKSVCPKRVFWQFNFRLAGYVTTFYREVWVQIADSADLQILKYAYARGIRIYWSHLSWTKTKKNYWRDIQTGPYPKVGCQVVVPKKGASGSDWKAAWEKGSKVSQPIIVNCVGWLDF